jgi:hypothetical protein
MSYYDITTPSTLYSYEPSPEFLNVASQDDAPKWVIQTYYILTLFLSLVVIVSSIGTIYSVMTCSHYENSVAPVAFEVIAWITLVFAFFLLIMTIFALVTKMGYAVQLEKILRPITRAYDAAGAKSNNAFRRNELNQNINKQDAMLQNSSMLQRNLDTDNFAYRDLETM